MYLHLLPPATKLGQGYVFTGVCDSVHRGDVRGYRGVCGCRGVCVVAGGHAWLLGGACVVARGACIVGGHVWLLGVCMVTRGHAWLWGVCVVAGGHAWLPGGACVVAGGHAWLLGGGIHGCQGCMCGCWGHTWLLGGHVWQRGACMAKGGCMVKRGACMSVQQYTQLHFSVILPDECGKATKVTAGAYHSATLTGKGLLSCKFLP